MREFNNLYHVLQRKFNLKFKEVSQKWLKVKLNIKSNVLDVGLNQSKELGISA